MRIKWKKKIKWVRWESERKLGKWKNEIGEKGVASWQWFTGGDWPVLLPTMVRGDKFLGIYIYIYNEKIEWRVKKWEEDGRRRREKGRVVRMGVVCATGSGGNREMSFIRREIKKKWKERRKENKEKKRKEWGKMGGPSMGASRRFFSLV